jgi:hypothetical protein
MIALPTSSSDPRRIHPEMSPVPKTPETNITLQDGPHLASHRYSKRFNLNPFHYLTLPLKKNWGTVGPAFDKFHNYSRTVSVILGAIGVLAMLDSRAWSLPRWPWAKDERSNPPPSFRHANERYTVDDLVDEKLMEMLEEMKVYEGEEAVPGGGTAVPEPEESENEAEKEAEEQFMEDAEEGAEDLVEEMELEGL